MIDLSELEMIDFHSHRVNKTLVSELVNDRAVYHLDFLGMKEEPTRSTLLRQRQLENNASPHYRALIHYIAQSYGCKPTLDDVDSVLKKLYEGNFQDYLRSILDRENIKIVQLAEPSPDSDFPKERSIWAFRCDRIIQPEWARQNGAKNLDQAVELVETQLKWAVKNGCFGIKTCIAYYRGLDVNNVAASEADAAFKDLDSKIAKRYRPHYGLFEFPEYDNIEDMENWRRYEDYIIKHIMIRSGQLGLPFHCHTGGGVAPSMDLRKVNPALLYSMFYDEDIANAGTRIVLLHCGVPYIAEAAAAASQFPHVYVDTSWPTRTETVRDIFWMCLREVSPLKILHGSDCSYVAERMGMGAWTARRMLSEVLESYRKLGWTEDECYDCAKLIFSENAKRMLKLSS